MLSSNFCAVCVGEGQAAAFLESPRPQLCLFLSSQGTAGLTQSAFGGAKHRECLGRTQVLGAEVVPAQSRSWRAAVGSVSAGSGCCGMGRCWCSQVQAGLCLEPWEFLLKLAGAHPSMGLGGWGGNRKCSEL